MKAKVLQDIVSQGKKPLVRLTAPIWDESFGEKGMIARVTRVAPSEFTQDDGSEFDLDYMEHKGHNVLLQTADWHMVEDGLDTGTMIESGNIDPDDLHEKMYADHVVPENADVPVELLEDGPMAEYAASGFEGNYVEWLERQLLDLRGQ